MAARYDAFVIGAGPAGTTCAGKLADGGMKVGIAERELVGGECSYWACIPSKTLLRPGEALDGSRHAPGAREAVDGGLHAKEALEWRNFQVSDWDDEASPEAAPWLREKGIDLHRGDARLEAPGRIRVGDDVVETERMVLATGSDPIIPPVEGLADSGCWTNRDATGMNEVPESVIVLGGGPVGVELAQALRRFGAQVAIVEGQRLLAREGEQAGKAIAEQLQREGIDLHIGVHAQQVSKQNGGVRVRLDDGSELSAQHILVATGRRPRLGEIGVEHVGLDPNARNVEVDDRLRAGANVWAIGDVTGVALFTHVGKYQARIAAADMLGKDARADYRALPRVTFCDPQVAGAGLTEEQARERGIDISTGTAPIGGVARTSTYTREYDEVPGFLTLIADRG
ncbi:MAG: dihydrolipoyl dehydrogenase family protein, partial [Thermoleophilaceae bacterium]